MDEVARELDVLTSSQKRRQSVSICPKAAKGSGRQATVSTAATGELIS